MGETPIVSVTFSSDIPSLCGQLEILPAFPDRADTVQVDTVAVMEKAMQAEVQTVQASRAGRLSEGLTKLDDVLIGHPHYASAHDRRFGARESGSWA